MDNTGANFNLIAGAALVVAGLASAVTAIARGGGLAWIGAAAFLIAGALFIYLGFARRRASGSEGRSR